LHRLDSASGSLSEGEQFRRLVEGVTDYAIYMLDPEGHVASWNAGAQRIKGYLPSEIIGRSFSTFYTDTDRLNGEPERALSIARTTGRFEREALRVRKDGSQFWAHVVIDAIHEDGELVGFAKITRDITERVETQRQLELAREQLFQSQKMEAIGQLTGGVAHDFNNLLMAVLGSLELLRKRLPTDDPKLMQLIENAELGAERGRALTQRMLAFARRQELELKPVDLGALLANMGDLLCRSLGPQVSVAIDVQPDLPPVTTDANQLETAILNLAVNARDAMPGGGAITISVKEMAPPRELAMAAGQYIRLAVADTGVGMDEETLARAAEPFFTTKGVGKGTGLGLSMVHGLAEQSGGRMSLSSRPDEGTMVMLWLPAAVNEARVETVARPAGTQPVPVESRPLVIVAVDDDPLVLMNTQAMLEDLGHTVIDAISGAEALSKLDAAGKVDLVITDHAMPTMTGSQLAREIRARWPALPIVLATGYAELPAGGNEELPRLSKPFSQAELAKMLERAVRPVA
jgi:PAS domain S-box-containing protein